MSSARGTSWRNRDVWSIALSAFFADSGYQSVLAGFPLFLVLVLHQPVWEFGLASALSYGGGALFSLAGARLGERLGHRRLALIGNAIIPLLSLSALVASPGVAIGLLCGGWWARNLRSPSRRVMLVEAVPDEAHRSAAFGFLHALDVGGGAVAGCYVLASVLVGLSFRWIFLVTVAPLVMSTVMLSRARTGRRAAVAAPARARHDAADADPEPALPGSRPLLAAAALYGFTYYSVGFPVLTLAQGGHHFGYGIGAFLVFQGVSAVTGYLLGSRFRGGLAARFTDLGVFGYLSAGLGSALLAAAYAASLGVAVLMLGVAVLGFALGVVETLEPSLMSVLRPGRLAGRAFGALSAARSIGLVVANLALGLLYSLGPAWSYGYAATVAAVAAAVILSAAPAVRAARS
ncbi:MAG: MFS transporter [Actinomycetota bacterium]|nr:MFS transporter [Actinomycetota bacterium]